MSRLKVPTTFTSLVVRGAAIERGTEGKAPCAGHSPPSLQPVAAFRDRAGRPRQFNLAFEGKQVLPLAGRKVIQHQQWLALPHEFGHNVAANEIGTTGNQVESDGLFSSVRLTVSRISKVWGSFLFVQVVIVSVQDCQDWQPTQAAARRKG